ncbi:MAG: M3 family oligoendopeptidase [Defluviitaleaceae bacterium]|nr:M3 family oligoendopeptidase [Defluviitaleaceae bacterium]MCL2224938.1 M3 family oligoendopeptidase [Defluviitaleaceae bacterium]MCL2262500.1 M3 family oligoendopeptidase [Defluviitaleaceae bacterium]
MAEKWCLNEIYAGFDSEEFMADFLELPKMAEAMNTLSGELIGFPDVVTLVRKLEEYVTKNDRLSSYANFVYATDTANAAASKFIYLLEALNAETSRMKVRLAKYLAKVAKDGGNINALAKEHDAEDYAFQLQHMAEEYSHMMSEDEETLAAQMYNTGSGAWSMLQDKLISMLTCEFTCPKTGEKKIIGINECRNLAYDADSAVRKAAYEAELAAYPKIEESCAAAMNGIKGEVNLLSRLRKFDHPLDKTLFDSNMTRKTLDAMFEAIDTDIQCFRDYLKAKAKYVSKSESGLAFYDLFAPVGASAEKTFSYEEAKTFVAENFGKFSSEMEKVARLAFDKNWVDVQPREGKVGGAFCGDIYAIKQFRVLLNFGGNLSDIITLAHELGHGYHSMQVMQEGILNTGYPMPLAETASTFCEMIVTNAALKTLPQSEKLQLIEIGLQDATQVILDIYSRYLFEKSVFAARLDHPLSAQELCELMLAAQRKAYGDGLDPQKLHPYMWAIKPHYYSGTSSFYNFPYAFGHLLANGLYKIYDQDPASFGKKYDNFLRVSGKMSITESCNQLGIDIENADFWKGAIDVIKSAIQEFKELTK